MVLTAFCSSPVRRASLSVKVSEMSKVMRLRLRLLLFRWKQSFAK